MFHAKGHTRVLDAVHKAVQTVIEHPADSRRDSAALPFVTISRQAGTDGGAIAQSLTTRLNALLGDPEDGWHCWGRELVEQIAADNGMSAELVDAVAEGPQRHWWDLMINDLFSALPSLVTSGTEFKVYRDVAQAIRALAMLGHAVIIGRGGMCITRGLPNGLHVCLVAPLEYRIEQVARRDHLSHEHAAEQVRKTDQNRERLYKHFWPQVRLCSDLFSVTFNVAALSADQIVSAVAAMIGTPALANQPLFVPLAPDVHTAVGHR